MALSESASREGYRLITETNLSVEDEELEKVASGVHGEIATTISGYIFIYLLQNDVGRVFDGRTTFQIEPDQPKREPDVSFVKLERLPQNVDDTVPLAPDLAVEIISSRDDWKAIVSKAVNYLRVGVSLVWVVDPYSRSFFVFKPDGGAFFNTQRDQDELQGEPVLPGFRLKVSDIFRKIEPIIMTERTANY